MTGVGGGAISKPARWLISSMKTAYAGGVPGAWPKRPPLGSYSAAIAARREILAMVARLTPIDFWISVQLAPPLN